MKAENRDKVYQVYVTDMLRMMVHNTAVYGVEGEGRYKVEARYADLIEPKKKKPKKEKPEETSESVIAKMKKSIAKLR